MRCELSFFLSRGALILLPLLPACSEASPLAAIDRGLDWLSESQSPDGSFRSRPYGILRAGHSLTAVISYCFSLAKTRLGKGTKHELSHARSLGRALEFLAVTLARDSRLGKTQSLADYPNYAAAFHLLALGHAKPAGWREIAALQAANLESVQLVEALDWEHCDVQYGGFGLGGSSEKKPLGAGYLNISVTAWVVHALEAFGHPQGSELFTKAAIFIERCQNFGTGNSKNSDGGFFFTTFPSFQQSKAGLKKTDAAKEIAALSYGSTTADGIRGLLACGQSVTGPRLRAARSWLEKNFAVHRVPGFPQQGAFSANEKALRLYYLSSLAHAMRNMEERGVRFTGKASKWRKAIQERLLGLQGSDGSWRGHMGMKEDDPLVGTSLALLGLMATLR